MAQSDNGPCVHAFLLKATSELKAGRKLYFSHEVCREIQNKLSDYIDNDVVIGFESSRSHHSPYLTIRK